MKPGDRIVTLLGRKGVITAIERVWLTVVFDDQPDWPMCFYAGDKWIVPAP
jgi:preprotein translocase subunit YajC